jgi:anthranilate/para-aminobenzoate synthase component I
LKKVRALPKALGTFKVSGKLEMSLTRAQYAQKFKKIQALIQAGEIYQVNFAIRFRQRFQGDPYALFTRWMKKNPATFGAYIDTGKFQILSASPERLLKVEKGMIITEPIKGTAAKSGGKKALETLLKSEKERAELDMITDLERNDIGKISEYGTVKVLKSRAVKELPNLWHCYSVVQGKLQKNATPEIILDALFPGGSITGCPKVRAMEVIENLEGLPRNIFTGSIGLVQKGKMDFNIAIRTALVKDGFIEYWAGGGIVADSNCDAEYDEALLKAERFLGILKS